MALDNAMQNIINSIRTSTYGHTVRTKIADAVEALAERINQFAQVTVDGSEISINEYIENQVQSFIDQNCYTSNETDAKIAEANVSVLDSLSYILDFLPIGEMTQADIEFPSSGYLNSADVIRTNSNYVTSAFIRVIPGASMKLECSSQSSYGAVIFYKVEDNSYVPLTPVIQPSSTTNVVYDFIVPDEAQYIRFSSQSNGTCKLSYTDETLATLLQNIYAAITAIRSRLTNAEESITSLNSGANSLGQRVTDVETTLSGMSDYGTRLSSIENELEDVSFEDLSSGISSISGINSNISSLKNNTGFTEVYDATQFDEANAGYYNGNFQKRASTSLRLTDYIPVVAGDTITVEFYNGTSLQRFVFLDESKDYVGVYPPSGEDPMEQAKRITVEFVVPNKAKYLRFAVSTYTEAGDDRNIAYLTRSSPSAYKLACSGAYGVEELKASSGDPRKLEFLMTPGKYIDKNTGLEASSNNNNTYNNAVYYRYWVSDYIPVANFDRIKLTATLYSVAGYGFYKGKIPVSFGSGYDGGDDFRIRTYYLDVPDGAQYFRFSTTIQSAQESYIQDVISSENSTEHSILSVEGIINGQKEASGSKVIDLYEKISMVQPPFEKFLSGDILCIGDSLTLGSKPSGSGHDYTKTVVHSYPEWLGILTGMTTATSAQSGYGPQDWYGDNTLNKAYTSYRNFIIWLGTNEAPTTEPVEDFQNETSGTETYYYRAIIEDIISAFNTYNTANNTDYIPRIFLGHVYASKESDVSDVNSKIDQIAALYPDYVVGVANMDDGSLYGPYKNLLHAGMNDVHFGPTGYFYLANKWLAEIRRCICDRMDLFDGPITT